ncbi:DUF4870 domain-containing protein [Paenibacillus sp. GCM10027626]|uniref:DUF4870 domain-containing protein n=1 Tax=Paenibacillus sp. GCM10027626 TaxID=3273411 RepID=UPI0036409299
MSPYMPDRSSTGIDPRIVGLLCYFGLFITGLLFLAIEKQSRFVKFHALQSILVSVAFVIINIVLGIVPIIGVIISIILAPISFVLWIALMLLALQGRWFKLPYIGDLAERQSQQF